MTTKDAIVSTLKDARTNGNPYVASHAFGYIYPHVVRGRISEMRKDGIRINSRWSRDEFGHFKEYALA